MPYIYMGYKLQKSCYIMLKNLFNPLFVSYVMKVQGGGLQICFVAWCKNLSISWFEIELNKLN